MASYGLKATVTAVLNDDDYDIGVTYSDSDGFSFDKRLTGDLDNIEQDVTAAILEVYLDILKQNKEKEKGKSQVKVETSTPLPVTTISSDCSPATENSVVSKFAELEEENRRLNEKINSFLKEKTCVDTTQKDDSSADAKKSVSQKKNYQPHNEHHHRDTTDLFDFFFDTDFNRFIRELPWL
jgi:hypothetical protein